MINRTLKLYTITSTKLMNKIPRWRRSLKMRLCLPLAHPMKPLLMLKFRTGPLKKWWFMTIILSMSCRNRKNHINLCNFLRFARIKLSLISMKGTLRRQRLHSTYRATNLGNRSSRRQMVKDSRYKLECRRCKFNNLYSNRGHLLLWIKHQLNWN